MAETSERRVYDGCPKIIITHALHSLRNASIIHCKLYTLVVSQPMLIFECEGSTAFHEVNTSRIQSSCEHSINPWHEASSLMFLRIIFHATQNYRAGNSYTRWPTFTPLLKYVVLAHSYAEFYYPQEKGRRQEKMSYWNAPKCLYAWDETVEDWNKIKEGFRRCESSKHDLLILSAVETLEIHCGM